MRVGFPIRGLLILLFIHLGVLTGVSQITGGIKGGVNLIRSEWSVLNSSDVYTNASLHVGIFFNVPIINAFSFQPEILYNGLKIEFAGQELATSYLSIPLLMNYSFFNDHLIIHAGPQFSFLLSAAPDSFRDSISDYETAITVGIGGKLKRFNIAIRYAVGLTNLASEQLRQDFPDARVRNNNLQLSIGYQLFGKVK